MNNSSQDNKGEERHYNAVVKAMWIHAMKLHLIHLRRINQALSKCKIEKRI